VNGDYDMSLIPDDRREALKNDLKERMTDQINDLVKSFLRDLPNHIPGVENISILEISEEFPT